MVAALGAVGALAWQARALALERKTRRAEIARIDADQHATRDAQARTIVLHEARLLPGEAATGLPIKSAAFSATLGNYGVLPITKVVASLSWSDPSDGLVHPTLSNPFRPVLAGGETETMRWFINREFDVSWPTLSSWEEREAEFSLVVMFNDVHGGRWQTDLTGSMQPVVPT